MSYDLFLIRDLGAAATWEDVDARFEGELADEDDLTFHKPDATEAQAIKDLKAAVHDATQGAYALDVGYETVRLIGVNLPYWPAALEHLEDITRLLNTFAARLGPGWVWSDPQFERVSARLDADALRDVFDDVFAEPPKTTWRGWVADTAIFVAIMVATFLLLQWLDVLS